MYFMNNDSRCKTYTTKKLIVENSLLMFTVSNIDLTLNCMYKAIIEAIYSVASTNSTLVNIEIARCE